MNKYSRTFYYARTSQNKEKIDEQLIPFFKLGIEKRDIAIDTLVEKDATREGYSWIKDHGVKSGDSLMIASLKYLAKSKSSIVKELHYLKEHNIRLKVIDIPSTMIDYIDENEWVYDVIADTLIDTMETVARQERDSIKRRQSEGIKLAHEKGVKLGRPPIKKPNNWDCVIAEWKANKITAKVAMELTGTKRTTFYKLVKNKG